MTDKEPTTQQSPTDNTQAPGGIDVAVGPVAAAGAVSAQQTHITNVVNVTVTPPTAPRAHRQPSGGHGRATTPARHSAPVPSAGNNAASQAPTTQTGGLEASGGHHYMTSDYNGNLHHSLIDREGDRVDVVVNRETGDTRLDFEDRHAKFRTTSDEPGLVGQRRLPYGFDGTRNVQMQLHEGALFDRGSIYCSDNVPLLSWRGGIDLDTASLTNRRVGELTVREVQEFMRRNPELGAELRGMNVAVTKASGQTLTAEQLSHLRPPATQACPTGNDDAYIGVVPRR